MARCRDVAIVAWIAVQIGVPASYYLRGGGPDERFAWRMYSTTRLTQCGVSAFETPTSGPQREIDLGRTVQRGWMSMLSRGQPRVIDAFLRQQCATGELASLELRRNCRGPDGSPLAPKVDARTCR